MRQSIQPALFALIAAFSATLFAAVPRRAARLPEPTASIEAVVFGIEMRPAPEPTPRTARPPATLSRDVSSSAPDVAPSQASSPTESRPVAPARAAGARSAVEPSVPSPWEVKYAGFARADLEQSLSELRAHVRSMSPTSYDARLTQGPHPLYRDANAPRSEPTPAAFVHDARADVAPEIQELYREIQWLAARTYDDGAGVDR